MLYKPVQLKILNPEDFLKFKYKNQDWSGKLILQIGYNKKVRISNLPIILSFRYRIIVENKHVATFLSDYKYYLTFQFKEDPYNYICIFLGKIILYFMEELYRITEHGNITPAEIFQQLDKDFILNYTNEIISEAQSQGLIRIPD